MGDCYKTKDHEVKVEKDNGNSYRFLLLSDYDLVLMPTDLYTDEDIYELLKNHDDIDKIKSYSCVDAIER